MAIIPFPDDLGVEQAVVAEEIRASRQGRLPDLFRIMLHSPAVARGWLGLGTALRFHTSLDDGIREMLICFVAQQRDCPYEVAMHTPIALDAGISSTVLEDPSQWASSSTDLAEEQRTALALAEVALAGGVADDETLSSALATFGEAGVLEIYALVAYYTAVALFMNGTGIADAPPS